MEEYNCSNFDREEVLDELYAHRAYAIDREETSWNIREEHWRVIDQLLDRLVEIDTSGGIVL